MPIVCNNFLKIGILATLVIFPKITFADVAQYIQWGTQLLSQKKYDDAAKYFNGAIKADPNNASAYKGMGYALIGKGEQTKALPYLKYSAQLNPSDTTLTQYIATLSGTADDPPALPVSTSEAAYEKGTRNMQAKQYPYAAYYFDQATKADPNSAKSFAGLGSAFYAQGSKDKAMAAWEKSLALDPTNTQLSQYVASLKGTSNSAAASATPAPETKQANFNPWIMGSTVAVLGAIMLFVF